MLETSFTKLVGCQVPLQQAGMDKIASPELAAAVSEAGGLGMLGTYDGMTLDQLNQALDRVQALTTRPFGVNFLVQASPELVTLAASRARVIEFFFVEPDAALVELVHSQGALACWNTGSVTEAVAAARIGSDLIGAQGIEAGGHIRGTLGLLPLLNEVLEVVDVPVIAAGGISSGRAMAGALAAGAAAVRVGTRFVAAREADAHPDYVAALIAASGEDTLYGVNFGIVWRTPHRVLRRSAEAAHAFQGDTVGEVLINDKWVSVPRFDAFPVTKDTRGAIEAMPHWAGQGVGAVKRIEPAGDIVRDLAREAEELLRKW